MIRPMPTSRITLFDVILTAVVVSLGTLLMVYNVVDPDDGIAPPSWVIVPLFLLVTVPVLWRRVAPLKATGAVAAGVAINVAAAEAVRCGIVIPVVWLMVFAVGARLPLREALGGLGLGLVAMTLMSLNDGVLVLGDMPFFLVLTVGVWGIGRIVASRGRIVDELEVRAAELQRARDDRAQLEVATERTRLSTELDELLQRRLGELAVLADTGAGQADSATATATLVEIETESRRTLDEMRAVVGVMRNEDATAPTAPQPTLTHLDALLVRAKGSRSRLSVEGNPRVLPAGVELSAYRVVEHLLDALEDAGDVEVVVRFSDEALELAVTGSPRRRADAALERARERLALHRGHLTTSTRGGRSRAVAQLPVAVGG